MAFRTEQQTSVCIREGGRNEIVIQIIYIKALVIKYLGVTTWKIIEASIYGMGISAFITIVIMQIFNIP